MKYYLVFNNNGDYLGYSDKENVIKDFLKVRGWNNYQVVKMKPKELSNELKEEINNPRSYLDYYDDGSGHSVSMFGYEDAFFVDIIRDECILFRLKIYEIYKALDYLRLNKHEKTVILEALDILETFINEFVEDENEPAYSEYLYADKLHKKLLKEERL